MPVHEDARNTIAFIERNHRAGKPFFINMWVHEPHTPFHTVPKYRWRFRDLEEADNIYASVVSLRQAGKIFEFVLAAVAAEGQLARGEAHRWSVFR